MLFNSIHFLIFLPLVVALYFGTGHSARKWILLAASYYFYMVFSIPLVLLLIWSTFIDFFAAQWIEKAATDRSRRALLLLSITSNLGLLFFFKYHNFTAFSLATVLGLPPHGWVLETLCCPSVSRSTRSRR